MAFFVTAISGFWGLKVKLVQVLKMPGTGMKEIVRDITCWGIPIRTNFVEMPINQGFYTLQSY